MYVIVNNIISFFSRNKKFQKLQELKVVFSDIFFIFTLYFYNKIIEIFKN